MWLKFLIIALLFFVAALMQVSFLPHFNIMGVVPNLVFILFFILIFFGEPADSDQGKQNEYYDIFFLVIVAGFFSDIFLHSYFGLSIIALSVVYYFKKLAVYFMGEVKDKYFIFYFIPIFLACFTLNDIILYLFSIFLSFFPRSETPFAGQFNFGLVILISLIYNLIFACVGFYIHKKISDFVNKNRQLKLL